MRRLTPTGDNERGATAIIFALTLTIIFGMGAVVVDVGHLYQEKRELQNGADAGALAVATDCARGSCGDMVGTAQGLADPNANDNAPGITVNHVLEPSSFGANTVKVDVSSTNQVAYTFARWFGHQGDTVKATAVARWLAVGGGGPLTIPVCEWENAGLTYPPDTSELPSKTITITFHDGNHVGCFSNDQVRSGASQPGNFNWLDVGDPCETQITVDENGFWAGGNPGNGNPSRPNPGCSPSNFPLANTDLNPSPGGDGINDSPAILIPIFDCVRNGSSGACDPSAQGTQLMFHVVGYAAFALEGYHLSNALGPRSLQWTKPLGFMCPGGPSLSSDAVCIKGRFVNYVDASAPGNPGAPNFGAQTVDLIK